MICVSIAEPDVPSCLNAMSGEKLVEIRFDKTEFNAESVKALFEKAPKGIDIIATCRPDRHSRAERKEILINAIEAGASYVDLELEAPDDEKEELIAIARKNHCKVIISYHNFEKTPLGRELNQVVDWCIDSGADIAKIACLARSQSDVSRLLSLYDTARYTTKNVFQQTNRKLISIAMGKEGKFSRIAALFLGAPFTYASLSSGKETAEGQIDRDTLKELMESLKRV